MRNVLLTLLLALTAAPANAESLLGPFVLIEGAEFPTGRGANQKGSMKRVESFEILDHPVTNAEYNRFIDSTGYAAPLHWADGRIPAGKEDFPVIFVNRIDVAAYLKWLMQKDGQIYRLPTSVEFEYAARGGLRGKTYPWGDEEPESRANFDPRAERRFDRWIDYLQPARFGAANGFSLYGMAGNVSQMTIDLPDPATIRFKYRIEDPIDLEQGAMGGSWAKSKTYLRCGDRAGFSHGIRHPDLGFRPVRKPAGSDWSERRRKLCAVPLGEGKVQVSWALIEGDTADTQFQVYRATERNHAGFSVSAAPVHQSTTFIDGGLKEGSRYQYYVRPVDASGREGPRSEWVGVTAGPDAAGVVTTLRPLFQKGSSRGIVPIFGDLNGDGTLDCVIRLDNGIHEMSQDPGMPVQIEAFTSYGRSLWRKDICWHDHCYGSANNVPFNVWDMDGDGRCEVITRLQQDDDVVLAILNGMTGEVLRTAPWPDMVSDFAKSSTRIHMSIAYLDGKTPAVVTQTGLYENEVFVAYNAGLKQLWRFDSFAETNGSGGHKIEVADVDGDGRQEVFDGTTCLNADGTLRWSIYKMHPDIVSIHDYQPDRPGLEVFYIVESNPHAGAYMVDASSGKILWKSNRDDDPRWSHGHYGWTSDIWDGAPGIECISNRAGHNDRNVALFSAYGKNLLEPFPYGYTPLEWDGDATRELIHPRDYKVGDFDGREIVAKADGHPQLSGGDLAMVADLYGDFRDELIVIREDGEERLVAVVTAVHPVDKRFLSATESLDYRLWLGRNMGGGYRSIFFQPLEAPGASAPAPVR